MILIRLLITRLPVPPMLHQHTKIPKLRCVFLVHRKIDCVEGEGVDKDDDGDMSLAQRKPRRQNRQLPMRFRDVLPQPPPTVPSEVHDHLRESIGRLSAEERPVSPVHTVKFRTCPNVFGLVRQYFSSTPPSHDPEECITVADLSNMPTPLKSTNYHLKLILNIILIPIVHPSSPGIGTGIRESKSRKEII
jgi:hypothetical protein